MSDDYWIRIDENGVGHCVIGSDLDDLNTPEEALKKAYEKGKEDGIAEANLKHNIECGDCVRQINAADEARIRAEEREKVLNAVIDCGWNCEVHSDKALFEMVEKQLKTGE